MSISVKGYFIFAVPSSGSPAGFLCILQRPGNLCVLRNGATLTPMTMHSPMFFVGDRGQAARSPTLGYAFAQLRQGLRWTPRGQHRAPRIQDLRHTFICRTLQRWYDEDVDIDRRILALSTYVGHVKITDTYWYMTATPELMAAAARRFEGFAGGAPS